MSGSAVTIETPKFFLGKKGSQFVSGSNNLIEISSSKFHLKNDGNVIMNQITASDANVSGKITTTEGSIGGFDIGTSSITSQAGGLTLNGNGGITGSKFLLQGGTITSDVTILGDVSANSIATGPGGGQITAQITAQGFARFVSASIGGFDVDGTTISDTGNNLVMSSSGQITGSSVLFSGGKIGGWNLSGTTLSNGSDIVLDSSNKKISINNATFGGDGIQLEHISGGGRFYAGDGSNKFIKFDGTDIDINTNKATISGSSIILKTNDFFLGKTSAQFISGSNNNIEITSSMFHLDPANNKVAISGSITATTGKIGGMLLENNKLRSQYGDGSVITHIVTVSGQYYINGVQQPTLELKVGNTYRFDNSHSSNGGHPFRFATSADGTVYSTGVTVVGSEGSGGTAYVQISVTASTPTTLYYRCTAHGGMGGQLNIITIGTLELNGVNGQITGSDVLIAGGKISGSNLEINVPNVTMSGSSVDIRTPKFFLGGTGQFISGSNSNIEISSSAFHLDPSNNTMTISGSITATDGNIGGFTIDSDEIKSTALASETVNYTVTNNGSSNYLIDGVAQPALTFVVGNTYVFTMASSVMSNHPFRIGTSANGSVISDGVTVTSTSLTIVVSASTPTSLYYFCTAHSGMGNSITVNAGVPKLLLNGELGQITASAAKITGDIVANTITANTAGTIGGFTLDSVGLKSSDGGLILSGSGQITASAAQITGKITAQTGTIGGFNIGTDLTNSAGSTLNLKGSSGQITASAAQITGKITATSGQIAGFDISGTKLQQGTSFHLDGNSSATYFISSSNFAVTPSGNLSASNALFDGTIDVTGTGTIAGWDISSTRLADSTDEIRLDSSAKAISIKNHSFGQSGIQLQFNSGTSRFYVGNGTNRFIQFDGNKIRLCRSKQFLFSFDKDTILSTAT